MTHISNLIGHVRNHFKIHLYRKQDDIQYIKIGKKKSKRNFIFQYMSNMVVNCTINITQRIKHLM